MTCFWLEADSWFAMFVLEIASSLESYASLSLSDPFWAWVVAASFLKTCLTHCLMMVSHVYYDLVRHSFARNLHRVSLMWGISWVSEWSNRNAAGLGFCNPEPRKNGRRRIFEQSFSGSFFVRASNSASKTRITWKIKIKLSRKKHNEITLVQLTNIKMRLFFSTS